MKKGKILMMAIVVAVIVSISVLATIQNFQTNPQPAIIDDLETGDMAGVSISPVADSLLETGDMAGVSISPDADSPILSDASSLQGAEFWTDENGTRHYTITAGDSPALED